MDPLTTKRDSLLTAQDDFVANLLENKLALQNRLVELRNQCRELEASTGGQEEDREEVARLARLRELEDEVEKYRDEYQDLNKTIDEDQSKLAFLESQRREAAERREEAKHGTKPGRKTLKRVGPPVTLVLINGSVAPFADKLIQGGKDGGKKASEMLRNEVQLESGTAAESETVMMVWLWYNRQDLIARLQADRVITVSSTWNNFAQGFARIVGNMLFDVDRNSVAEHMTAILTKFGFMGNVEKIYLAGAHPGMALLPLVVQDEEGPPEELEKAFEEVVLPKIVLIDHRPHEPKEDLGGPTVTFAGLFDSSSSRPIIPPIQSDPPQQGNDSFIASVVSVPAASPRCVRPAAYA
ncbi:zinc finger, CCCH-type protein [Rhodotorula toruloides]|uniref:Zinc finger, CCCH-type protein n=1 Tax=Rhodotorula toruloides TaxID=5286 RepID=A0A511KMN6_RHOTO|nr:zinc finger, CCCH-type protein [Rhodotorula toruloides]